MGIIQLVRLDTAVKRVRAKCGILPHDPYGCGILPQNPGNQDIRVIYIQPKSQLSAIRTANRIRRIGKCLLAVTICASAIFGLYAGIRSTVYPPSHATGTITVKVESGDSLWAYVRKYGDKRVYIPKQVHRIAEMNHLDSNKPLEPGQEIVIPVSEDTRQAYLHPQPRR